ncbi:MAG: hypothetical protein JOZ57_06590 [Abitibacteriaceae bacterium]|nr:hypothetical protein [Abditibacteriaceae bacterium]
MNQHINSSLSIKSGFRVEHPALMGWETLLEEWVLLIERYCRLAPGKAPYWYSERSNVGLLAGAAWRCGWISLEEFQAEQARPGVAGGSLSKSFKLRKAPRMWGGGGG